MLIHSDQLQFEEELAPYDSMEIQPAVLVNQNPIVSVTTGQSDFNSAMVSTPVVSIMQAPIISVTSPTHREQANEARQEVWSL